MSPATPWIDAHCHLADPRREPSLEAVLERSRARGVGCWIQGGIDPADWERQRALRVRLGSSFVPVFGLHPWWAAEQTGTEAIRAGLDALEKALPGACAIGELGLDYGRRHGSEASRPNQREAFSSQLALARGAEKPVVLHIVNAHGEALAELERDGALPAGGIVHAFSGSYEVAKRYVDLGLTLSIGGGVTRKGYLDLKKAIPSLPADKIVVETDAPDQAPDLPDLEPGELNEPRRLVAIAEVLGHLRGETAASVLDRSARTLKAIFGL